MKLTSAPPGEPRLRSAFDTHVDVEPNSHAAGQMGFPDAHFGMSWFEPAISILDSRDLFFQDNLRPVREHAIRLRVRPKTEGHPTFNIL